MTAIIAFVAIPFVLRNSGFAKPIVWTFNIFGTVDLLATITTATIYNAPVAMEPAYWTGRGGATIIGNSLRDARSPRAPPGKLSRVCPVAIC